VVPPHLQHNCKAKQGAKQASTGLLSALHVCTATCVLPLTYCNRCHSTPALCHSTGIYKPGTAVPTASPNSTSSPAPSTGPATKPDPTAAPSSFPTKGPLAAVPGQSTFDGCAPGCALCLVSDKSTCLSCTDVRAYSNVNGTCVCGPGRGGSGCTACETGSYSAGGTLKEPTPACKKCRVGFSTKGTGATDVADCNGECCHSKVCHAFASMFCATGHAVAIVWERTTTAAPN
jgi:hypothetical protein